MLGIINAIKEQTQQMKANSLSVSTLGIVDIVVSNITATASTDLKLIGVTGKDIIAKLTDAAGARKFLIKDSGDVTVASIDSDGVITGSKIVGPVPYAHATTGAAPTSAQLVSAFGAAATVGAGFRGVFKDDTASTGKTYLVICDGAAYHTIQATAAEATAAEATAAD
jgi:hypothetical protein